MAARRDDGRSRREWAGSFALNATVAVLAAGGVSWAWMAGEADRAGPPKRTMAPPMDLSATAVPGKAPSSTTIRRSGAVAVPLEVRSGWSVPVAGVAASALTDSFGDGRSEGRVHRAIDVMAPRGTPVLAAADGAIVKLFTSAAGGLTVYQRIDPRVGDSLAGGAPIIAYYAHFDAYAPGLAEGQRVARGTPIGTVGFTGNGSPDAPHLHFQLLVQADGDAWHEGEPINPYPLLSGTGLSTLPSPASIKVPDARTIDNGPGRSAASGAAGAALAPDGVGG